jgi:hypothetical protein
LVTGTSLQPDINNANVWAMHGRGVQITDNASDINGNPRPTTLTTGVPDLGAYEFLPAVIPPVCRPQLRLQANSVFYVWNRYSSRESWGTTVPTNVEVRRTQGHSSEFNCSQQSMYFYTDVDITGASFKLYIETILYRPMDENIPSEPTVKMGRTNAGITARFFSKCC